MTKLKLFFKITKFYYLKICPKIFNSKIRLKRGTGQSLTIYAQNHISLITDFELLNQYFTYKKQNIFFFDLSFFNQLQPLSTNCIYQYFSFLNPNKTQPKTIIYFKKTTLIIILSKLNTNTPLILLKANFEVNLLTIIPIKLKNDSFWLYFHSIILRIRFSCR